MVSVESLPAGAKHVSFEVVFIVGICGSTYKDYRAFSQYLSLRVYRHGH